MCNETKQCLVNSVNTFLYLDLSRKQYSEKLKNLMKIDILLKLPLILIWSSF